MAENAEATVRVFIAVPVHETLFAPVRQVQKDLQQSLRSGIVRWTRENQFHLTLKFLGNVPANRLESLKLALHNACAGAKRMDLSLNGVGCFPTPRRPNVVWVGVAGQVELLQKLQERIEMETKHFESKPENRPFRPHLTIGRVSPRAGRESRVFGPSIEQLHSVNLGTWTVEKVQLMQSDLAPGGSIYTELEAIPLTEAAY